ncbi:MAG: AAA family ATPase [Nanoarchaeota archaeon]
MEYKGIAISGLPGSGKTTLAKEISEIYGWSVFSIGQLWREKWRSLYPNGEVSFEDFWRNTSLRDNLGLNLKAREDFREGGVIIDTRYAIFLKDLQYLMIFVMADINTRAKRLLKDKKYGDKTLGEIKDVLIARERDELAIGKQLVNDDYDYRKAINYHTVLDSGLLTVEQEVKIVRTLMES